MSAGTTKIRAQHLSKVFGSAPDVALERLASDLDKDAIFEQTGSVVAVADVSFAVGQGEIFVVMGLSGSGKSTLVRCINRLIEPSAGTLWIDDEDVLALEREPLRQLRLHKVAMVFQHFALFPHRTVCENVEFGLKIRGVPPDERRERALAALDMVGLRAWADVAPSTLSGGMQQRVGLARALAVDPEVLLMDEPFSALDPLIRREMQQELIELQRRLHMTIIFITHDLHEALTIGDQIAIMKDGRFVQVGSPEEIVAAPADPYVASFTQDVDRSRVITAQRIMRPAATVDEAALTAPSGAADLRADADGALFVIDRDRRPVGLLLAGDLGPQRDPATAVRRDLQSAARSTLLGDLLEACAQALPIAVLEDGRLAGVVHPRDVLLELARDSHGQASGRPAPQTGAGTERAQLPSDAREASHV
jgi:glycine betaine/proline transport system ATP-binding protein